MRNETERERESAQRGLARELLYKQRQHIKHVGVEAKLKF
jgi:hypothetical protein